MPEDPPVSRGEFDMLRQLVAGNQARLENIDDHGTRGVGAVQVQVTEIVKDVAALQAELGTRFETHDRQHLQDHKDRIAGRRWLIGTGIAGVATMAGVISLLIEVLSRLHP